MTGLRGNSEFAGSPLMSYGRSIVERRHELLQLDHPQRHMASILFVAHRI